MSDGISLGSIPKGTPLDVNDPNRSLCRSFSVDALFDAVCFFRETDATKPPPFTTAEAEAEAAAPALRNIPPAPFSPSIIAAAAAAAAAAASAVRLSLAWALANAPATNVARNAVVNAKCVRYPSVSRPNTNCATASISSRRTRRVATSPSSPSARVAPGRLKWFLTHRQYIRPSSPRSAVNAASVARIASTRARSIGPLRFGTDGDERRRRSRRDAVGRALRTPVFASHIKSNTMLTTTIPTRWTTGVDDGRSRRRRARTSRPLASSDASSDAPARKQKEKKSRKSTGDILKGLWNEVKYKPLREDASIEAVALLSTLELAKRRPEPGETWTAEREEMRERAVKAIPGAVGEYWSARSKALIESEAVRDAAPLMSSAVNVAIAGVVLRLFLPRVAALQAVGGFDELTEFFGLPPRSELSGYLDQLQSYPAWTVFAVYVGLFMAEKITMTDEFLPIGFVLPVISPAVFGGVFGGTMVTSLASTLAASVNFFLGRYVFKEKILAFKWGENDPVGEQKWFGALSRRFDSSQFPESVVPEGFKSALLLRLCPILPIPISGNWYVCGLTPLKFKEFFAAHFIGSSKTAFIDAYLGSILLTAVFDESSIKDQAQGALVFETVAIMAISILVSTYATELFTQVLDEEGVDAGAMMGFGGDDGKETKEDDDDDDDDERRAELEATAAFIAAAALPVKTAEEDPIVKTDDTVAETKSDTPPLIPAELMPSDEKRVVEEGEDLWKRATRVEAQRQKLTMDEMIDHEAMDVDM